MKKNRRGFTLVEILIVVAIIGVLAATMTMSSTDAIDSAGANNILSNLQSMKVAAMEMYMEEPEVASTTDIKLDGTVEPTSTKKPLEILAGYLGKKSDTVNLGDAAGKYALLGNADGWYVVYHLSTADSAGLRTKLGAKAEAADLFGATATTSGFSDPYKYEASATTEVAYVALKVR